MKYEPTAEKQDKDADEYFDRLRNRDIAREER